MLNTQNPSFFRSLVCSAFLFVLALSVAPANANDTLPLFQDEEPIKITISSPLSDLVKAAKSGKDEFEATLTYHGAEGDQLFNMALSPRGKTRRAAGICSFPPLRVDLKKKEVPDTLFHGQNKLKVVTHCQKSGKYEDLYAKEYMIYKAYNVLTPLSFKVRMAEITYEDTSGKSPFTKRGFFIEDVDDVAERNGLVELKTVKIRSSDLDARQATIYAMFQYLIANLDWSHTQGPPNDDCCHNTKLINADETVEGGGLIPVPYDFDYSGIVDAPYAIPPANLKVSSVRTRLYRGFCRHNDQLPEVIALFLEKEGELRAAFNDETLMSKRGNEKTAKFLDGFFETLKEEKKVNKAFYDKCV